MNQKELAEQFAKEFFLTKKKAEEYVSVLIGLLQESLIKEQTIRLKGFGALSIVDRKGHIGRNLKTGEAVEVPPHKVVKFQTSRDFLDKINKK